MARKNFIEVYEITPGKGRAGYNYKPGVIECLPIDGPLPAVGDIILLPRNMSCSEDDQAYIMGEIAPFRVVEREHAYIRSLDEEHDPINTKPARYMKTWIHVERIPKEEYAQDPGVYDAKQRSKR